MSLRLLILGAHPDDPDFHAGGLAAIYRRHGHVVKMISLTNGDAGHHRLSGRELADIGNPRCDIPSVAACLR